MFSTFGENNSFPLSYYHSPSLTNQESNTTYLQQTYHQNLFQGPYNYMPSFINPSICENPMNNYSIPHHSSSKFILEDSIDPKNTLLNCPFNMNNDSHPSKRAVAKKDRHTKISTAQGVRDRRVRLSISIAREFFNLQDMLGFDKASKTLGWLLGKSKAAIDELASSLKNNNGTSKCSSSASENEIAAIDQNTIEEENEKQNLSGKTIRKKRGRKVHNGKSCNGEINAREVRREKARERARERTKNKKMMVSNLNNHQMMENSSSSSPHHQHNHHHYHQRDQQNLMICQSSCSYDQINPTIKVGESVVIKSKYLKESCHNRDHDINFNDYQEGCNYNSDDHLTKFAFESNGGFPSLNINNLSTEIHINAKPWETSSNQILH